MPQYVNGPWMTISILTVWVAILPGWKGLAHVGREQGLTRVQGRGGVGGLGGRRSGSQELGSRAWFVPRTTTAPT